MMKRFGSAALALALAGSLVPAALAAEDNSVQFPMDIIADGDNAQDIVLENGVSIRPISAELDRPLLIAARRYATALTLNGQALDTAAIPADGTGLIPMRLVAEADYGSAAWYEEENLGAFYLDGSRVEVSFADNSVMVNGEALEGVTATVLEGVTFLPVDVIAGLEGYEVAINDAEGVETFDISTPNSVPLVKLAREIIAQTEAATAMKASLEDLDGFMGISSANYTEVASFAGMMTRPDFLFIGKLAEDADVEAAKAELQAKIDSAKDTFSWYLSQNLYIAEEARIVESNGYLALLMVPNSELAEELFTAGVAESAEA